eukprot:scaffold26291_cov57-Phaeocystis_antarctica.AAC.5
MLPLAVSVSTTVSFEVTEPGDGGGGAIKVTASILERSGKLLSSLVLDLCHVDLAEHGHAVALDLLKVGVRVKGLERAGVDLAKWREALGVEEAVVRPGWWFERGSRLAGDFGQAPERRRSLFRRLSDLDWLVADGTGAPVGRDLSCHGTRYVRHARGWYVCPVRKVRGASGQAALCLRYVQHAGGWYARPVPVNTDRDCWVAAEAKLHHEAWDDAEEARVVIEPG